ncbi:SufE family protein [Celerinatantimonas sp. YJH-8]|uniref:SufE family protein n=1 Tax=Celerinatantimonas sp. YJH-8 TaxID=3228714 RepID=UPI0038CA5289
MNYPQLIQQVLTWDKLETQFQSLSSGEERYRQLLLLGKALPRIEPEKCIAKNEVQGCESKSWFYSDDQNIWIDSEARVIRGLIYLLLLLCQHTQDPALLMQLDLPAILNKLKLQQFLSTSRINGIQAIWSLLIHQ